MSVRALSGDNITRLKIRIRTELMLIMYGLKVSLYPWRYINSGNTKIYDILCYFIRSFFLTIVRIVIYLIL